MTHTPKDEQKYEKTTCYCDAPDHEMCWDGLVGLYDPNCSCCKDTQQQLSELDGKEVRA